MRSGSSSAMMGGAGSTTERGEMEWGSCCNVNMRTRSASETMAGEFMTHGVMHLHLVMKDDVTYHCRVCRVCIVYIE